MCAVPKKQDNVGTYAHVSLFGGNMTLSALQELA